VRLSSKLSLVLIGLVVGIVLILSPTVHLITEWWWYDSLGQVPVFMTVTVGRSLAWGLSALLFFLCFWGNYQIALKLTRYSVFRLKSGLSPDSMPVQTLVSIGAVGLSLFLAISGASGFTDGWEVVWKYFNSTPFGSSDPIFGQDVGFYIFQLPAYDQLKNWLIYLVVGSLATTVPVYVLKGSIDAGRGWQNIVIGRVKAHLTVLISGLVLLIGWGYWLQRYELLYSTEGVVFGAGYTDAHSRLLSLAVLSLGGAIAAGLLWWSLRRNGVALAIVTVTGYVAIALLLPTILPALEQNLFVAPNELTKEKPYITHSIDLTRQAYGLDQIQTQPYPVESNLNWEVLNANPGTINNIRLWDYRPLLSTYRELQELRLYYSFRDVDIDRYTLEQNYRQVMLSGRELDYSQVPDRAQTWVNQRLKYTHGYGAVMSPVNRVTPQGLPELFIQDIPPQSSIDITIDQPRIYYGEATDAFIYTGMSTDEFDYPIGDENAANRYDGLGGVPMPSFFHRLLYAIDRRDFKVLISNYFTPASRIHYHRTIRDRVQRLAPFLRLDRDPYLAIIDGRLQWLIDGYTISDRFPYSEPISPRFNYIRNSVKVLVDAYDGTVQFFVVDPTDPVLQTYAKIFPSLFTNDPIPDNIRAHFRYPVDLFQIQAQMYLSYHMTSPEVFYNQEDLWRLPTQLYEDQEEVMEPYYVIMKLPESEQEEFLLILPFTPVNKDNMVAWMAARCDGDNYGTALLYDFPKQELIYGPQQIEARIDQDSDISPQLTLWSQEGSQVIRGDLLIIPLENSLLYVEPIYLRAEQSELPELKQVIVAYDEQIVMRETLEESLAVVFGQQTAQPQNATPTAATSSPQTATPSPTITPLAQEALETYQAAQDALQAGNWAEYGELTQQLETLLQELNDQVTPQPTE
jgi:uncharacterized membrane protein (UPF0182 family)